MAFYNVSKIENWFDDFTSCKNKFINTYYDDYQDSYIRTCNDEIIRKMKTQLDNHYNKIKRIYNRINDHWSNYLNDLKNIDNCIAGTSNPFSVYAPAPAAKLNSLPCLKEYEANLATKIESFSGYIGTVTFLGWSEDKDTSENLLYIFERTGATVGTAVVSVIEGIGMFGEGIVDVCTTVVSECYCQVRLAVDDDFTEKQADIIRESTRDVVSTQYVKNKFDSFYQESDVGAYLSENAYAFDAVRSIGNEVGIVVGAVVVSSLTQGAIPPSVLYGISKAGNHIEENFQDENNGYFESIVKGGLAGALDGVFFAAGAKGDQVLKATIGKSAAKNLFAFSGKMGYEAFCAVSQDGSNIVLDSLFMDNQIVDNNGNTIYFENYKDKLSYCYEQAGGKEAIIESLVTSVVLSGMSDGVDTIKAVRNIDAGSAIKNIDVSSSSIDTNASGISKQIDGISSKTSVFDDVETNGVNIDSNTAVKNMDINSSSMGTNTSKISKQIDEVTSKTSIFNEENIAALNNKIAKDNFVGIKVDSEADIPDDIWERISRPKNDKDVCIITADGKKFFWGEDVHPRMLEGNGAVDINSLEVQLKNSNSKFNQAIKFDELQDAAIFFDDPKQFLYQKLKKLADLNDPKCIKKLNEINDPYKKYFRYNIESCPSVDLDEKEIYHFLKKNNYLSKNDIAIYKNLKSSNIYSDLEKATIFHFTKWDGPNLSAYNRKATINYRGNIIDGTDSIELLENTNFCIRAYNNVHGTNIPFFKSMDEFNSVMDDIVNRRTLKEDIIVYRAVDDLFFDGTKLDLDSLKPGDVFNDSAHTSASVKKVNFQKNSTRKVQLEIYAKKGTPAAYLESYTGVSNYNQQEILFARDSSYKILGYPKIDSNGVYTIRVELLPQNKYIPKVNEILDSTYRKMFNKVAKGKSTTEIIYKMQQNGMMYRYNNEVDDIVKRGLYDGPKALAEHDLTHVKNVLLYTMNMADDMNLSSKEFDMVVDCAKYHDVGVVNASSHTNHSILSSKKLGLDLSNKYDSYDLKMMQAIVELHESNDIIKLQDGRYIMDDTSLKIACDKYGIKDQKDIDKVRLLTSILKDADALDRTRFPGNIDINYFRNKNIALEYLGASYDIRECISAEDLYKRLNSGNYSQQSIEEIIKLVNSEKYPYAIIDYAFKYYKNYKYSSITEFANSMMESLN